ncbi:DUF6183 family protein [Streptomyces hawaiiensis]|uniref:DUF6183 family protein n=1 Tax=Streptomyces hawaiiensis TaxID=67305 RepID=UPI003667BC32
MAGEDRHRGSALACATTPDDVLNELLSAAYSGGVNGRGQGGAYARLYAWDSLYALMGLPADVPFLEAVWPQIAGGCGSWRSRTGSTTTRRTWLSPCSTHQDSGRGAGGDRYRRRPRCSRVATGADMALRFDTVTMQEGRGGRGAAEFLDAHQDAVRWNLEEARQFSTFA